MLPAAVESATFDLPPTPPTAVGDGKYRVAGVVYRGLLEFIASNVAGGLERVRHELHDPRLSHFLGQRFQATGWYDGIPLPYIGTALARIRGVSFEQQLRDSNRWSEARSGALYRALLKLLSAEAIALAIPRAATIVNDFGKASTEVVAPRHVRGVRSGVPRTLVRWLALSNGFYFEFALTRAGAQRPRVSFGTVEPDSASNALDTWRLPFDVTWG